MVKRNIHAWCIYNKICRIIHAWYMNLISSNFLHIKMWQGKRLMEMATDITCDLCVCIHVDCVHWYENTKKNIYELLMVINTLWENRNMKEINFKSKPNVLAYMTKAKLDVIKNIHGCVITCLPSVIVVSSTLHLFYAQ